jgi:DegV family protein with EDD domain
MRIKISSDSTCDLSSALIARYGIEIVPLPIIKGDVSYKDGVDIFPEDIFKFVDSGAGACHTSAINISSYQETFRTFASAYDAVIHITLSSGISSCYQNALIAAEEYDNVFVVDSRNLSTGHGHVVLDAAVMAQEGYTAQEIVDRLNTRTGKVEASFVIDSLLYLYKGGRCSGVAALGANVLKLKPCIEVVDSKMDVGKKYRGNFDKVILQYVTDRLRGRGDIDYRRIFVTYAPGVAREIVDNVVAKVKELGPFEEIIETTSGGTISCHCGPVCLGILFYRK